MRLLYPAIVIVSYTAVHNYSFNTLASVCVFCLVIFKTKFKSHLYCCKCNYY